jgi:hypothetical protein
MGIKTTSLATSTRSGSSRLQRPVVVAMVSVRKMQVAIDEIADMVPMWDSLVSASRPVYVTLVVTGTDVIRRAALRVGRAHLDDMLVDVAVVHMVQVTVVEVVDMIAMAHGRVAASWAVNV